MDAATIPVSTRLRRTTPYHDAYTVRVYDSRFTSLATARPADARRWVATTRWLHGGLIHRGRLVVGLGVQWTPTRAPLSGGGGGLSHVPATLQLCVGHRCLVLQLARADALALAIPEALRRFLADPRVTFVGSGSAYDARMLWEHYGLDVARREELRAVAAMGANASLEQMAARFLAYPGIHKPRDVAMSAWHAPRLSLDQVQYASVDAYLAFRLGVLLLRRPSQPSAPAPPPPPHPVLRPRSPPPARAPHHRVFPAPGPPVIVRAAPPARPAHLAPVAQKTPMVFVCSKNVHPAFSGAPTADNVVGGDAAITGGSKVMDDTDTHVGLIIDESDTESSDMDSYDDVYRAATRGLPVRAYASDSDCSGIDSCSDGFEHVRFGAFTDDEEDEDDGSYTTTGSLGADDVDGDGKEEKEGCNEDVQEDDEEGYDDEDEDDHEDDEKDHQEDEEDEECYTTDGMDHGPPPEFLSHNVEYLGHIEVVHDGSCSEDALAQDGWYDQEVDYGSDRQDDGEEEFEEFYLL